MATKIIAGLMLKNENRFIKHLDGSMPKYTMLEQCLSCVSKIADEIIIVDNDSTDGSQEVYKKFPKITLIKNNEKEIEFSDYRDRKFLLEEAIKRNANWFLMIDGDEVFEDRAIRWIKEFCETTTKTCRVKFRYINFWRSRDEYRTDAWNTSKFYRLWSVDKDLTIKGEDLHYYELIYKGNHSEITSPYYMLHYGWADWDHRIEKSKRYAAQHAKTRKISLKEAEEIYFREDLGEIGLTLEERNPIWLSEEKLKITLVVMIYKSLQYLELVKYMLRKYGVSEKYNVDWLIVGNDPNEKIINELKNDMIPYLIYNDKNPEDYYLNRVYRAWNFGGKSANGDIVVFLNSDFGYSERWLDNLISHYRENQLPCSRLVESGKMISGLHGISKNFGKSPKEVIELENSFNEYAEEIAIENGAELGGLYMPCAINKKIFIETGGFPEGNVTLEDGNIISGDKFYFEKLEKEYGIKHITAMDSIVYHIQEGEMDE